MRRGFMRSIFLIILVGSEDTLLSMKYSNGCEKLENYGILGVPRSRR